MLRSALCRQRDFSSDWYTRWTNRIARGAPTLEADKEAVWGAVWAGMRGKWMHRKLWEWCAIAQALDERGMLATGKRGIGFAVGHEPLASLFASCGADVIASDYHGDSSSGWADTGQLGASLKAIHWPGLIDEGEFRARVEFRPIDMRNLSDLPSEHYDFMWSSCSFEHLGSLDAGAAFVHDAMRLLRSGGVAVHTTEFNVSSNDETVAKGGNVIYRRQDIERLDGRLRKIACGIEALDFEAGTDPHDLAFDVPPYYQAGKQHLKLKMMGHISTSILLIVRKG